MQSRSLSMRLAGLLALMLALCAEPASAQMPVGSRIFTLAGGGAAQPHDGALATGVRIGDPGAFTMPLAAMPDGSIATLDGRRNPLLIGVDGRIRMLPRIAGSRGAVPVGLLAAEPDGSLLACSGELGATSVYRLAAGAASWSEAASLRAIVRRKPGWTVTGLTALPSGAFAFSGYDGLRRVEPDGTGKTVVAGRPGRSSPRSLAALPDGSLAFVYGNADAIAILAPDGTLRRIRGAHGVYDDVGLASMADGTLMRAEGRLDAIAPNGRVQAVAGRRPGLGPGDGGRPDRAELGATDVAVTADGAIVVAEITPFGVPRPRWDLPADRLPGGWLLSDAIGELDSAFLLRVIVPPDSSRPLAAITAGTFTSVRQGWVEFATTVPGEATLTLRRSGRRPIRVTADVAAGVGRLRLPAPRRGGDDALALVVRAADGSAAAGDLAVATARRMSKGRAVRIIRRVLAEDTDIGYYTRMGRCRRVSAVRIDCQSINVIYDETNDHPTCDSVATARLRPDGVRVVRGFGRRRCRSIGR
jgi:hypothetical protein